jgi:glycosyltransferase involved in cell wall biosynthesis
MDKVSIIIPTYKRVESFTKALSSVVNQSYTNLEIIVVNDDAQEQSVIEVVNNFNDSRILYSNNKRKKGGNGARNTGVLTAKGRYITFLDDDDEFEKNRIKECLLFIKKTNLAGISTGFTYKVNNKYVNIPHKTVDFTLNSYLLDRLNLGYGSNLFINTDFVSDEDLLWDEDLERHQDVEYIIRLLAKYDLGYLSKHLVLINGHNGTPCAEQVEKAKILLFQKIEKFLFQIDDSIKSFYFAIQYRELALLYCREKKYEKMWEFVGKSIKSKILSPQKYLRFISLMIRNIFKLNLENLWHKINHQPFKQNK